MIPWTNDQLLVSIRFRAGLPDTATDEYWTDANLLQICNEEATSWLTPLVLEMRQEYLINSIDYAAGTAVAEQNNFYIPAGAVGNRLRCVRMCDSQHNPIGPQLEQLDIKDVRNVWTPGIWGSFFIKDNAVVLIGNIPQGYFVRLDYERRLNTLVSATLCAQITAISGNVVTCGGGLPGTFTNGTLVDFITGDSPFVVLGTLPVVTPVGNTITFATPPPSAEGRAPQVGDWLALTGTSPFIGLPQEVFPLFAEYMSMKVLQIKRDPGVVITREMLDGLKNPVKNVLAPRSLGNKKTPGSMLGQVVGPGVWGWSGGL